jgi:hypothetical protein
MLDSWSAGYRVAPGREASRDVVIPPTPLAGVQEPWSSDHRPVGIFVAAGPHIGRAKVDQLSLYDICPTGLALLENEIPLGLDGCPAEEALNAAFLAAHPIRTGAAVNPRPDEAGYSEEEAASVASHLKELGYIE